MKHKLRGVGMALVCGCAVLSGCELLHHEERKVSETIHEEPESDALPSEAVTSKPPKGFFAPSRLSGAWSSEARSIERNLGVE